MQQALAKCPRGYIGGGESEVMLKAFARVVWRQAPGQEWPPC